MKTSFDTWLAELAAGGLGGSALTSSDTGTVTRGLAWSFPFAVAGDWTAASVAATVSASPDAASPLVTCTVSSPEYDPVSGTTIWTASLASGTGADTTGFLPSDTDGDGVEYFPFMVRLTPSGGSAMTIIGGALPVVGKV